jgi:hypothetical protein
VSVRIVPWFLALAALVILLVGSGFVLWIPVAVWLSVLAVLWAVHSRVVMARDRRISAAIVLVPVLFLLAFEGGWYLIPADLAWLAIELVDSCDPPAQRPPATARRPPAAS